MSEVIDIYTDGACKNSPGPGGWAAVIITPHGANLTVRGRDHTSTNNRMELTAAVKGLQGLQKLNHLISKHLDLPVILHSDSKHLTDAFNQNWLGRWKKNDWKTGMGKPVSNRDLWDELLLLAEQRNITWQWVKGHGGNYFNDLCDQIATEEAEMAKKETEVAARQAAARPRDQIATEKAWAAAQQPAARPHETPDDFQTGSRYELEPVQPEQMEVLDLIFRIVDKAKSFKHFKEQMARLGGEYQLGTVVLREHLRPSTGRENAPRLDCWSHPEENERNGPSSESGPGKE